MAEQASQPSSISLPSQPTDCATCVEVSDLFAVGLITGRVQLHRLAEDSATEHVCAATLRAHSTPCRSLCFAAQGGSVLSASADSAILAIDAATARPTFRLRQASKSPISRLSALGPSSFCSADESGTLKLWDTRQAGAIGEHKLHRDFVTDLCVQIRHRCLLSVGADGALCVFDWRANKVLAKSDGDPDDELLSVSSIKHDSRIVCGSQTGNLHIFTHGKFEEPSDRISGCPSSVDALIKFDEDTVISGSEDGLIRLINVQPHNTFGTLNRATDTPVERLAHLLGRQSVISVAHENAVQIHDVSFLVEEDMATGSDEEEQQQSGRKRERKAKGKKAGVGTLGKSLKLAKKKAVPSNMFSDLLVE